MRKLAQSKACAETDTVELRLKPKPNTNTAPKGDVPVHLPTIRLKSYPDTNS